MPDLNCSTPENLSRDGRMIPPTRLSADLRAILDKAQGKDVSFNQVLRTIRGRGFPVLLLLLSLPFVFPVLPGLSTPFGLAIILFGARIAIGRRPLLPRWLLRRHISFHALERMIGKAVPMVARLEKLLCPRMHFLQRWPSFRRVNGAAVLSNGLVMALPLPIPFTNTIPALAIVLLSAGMMEEDGLFILAGYAVTGCAWLYLLVLVWLGHISLDALFHWAGRQ